MAEGDNNDQSPGLLDRLRTAASEVGDRGGSGFYDFRPIETVRRARTEQATSRLASDEVDPSAPNPARYAGLGPTGRQRLYLRSASGQYDQLQEVPNDQVNDLVTSGRAVFPAGTEVPVARNGQFLGRVRSEDLARFIAEDPLGSQVLLGSALQTEVSRRNSVDGERGRNGFYEQAAQVLRGAGQRVLESIEPNLGVDRRRAVQAENARRLAEAERTGGVYVPVEDGVERRSAANPIVSAVAGATPEIAVGIAIPGLSSAGIRALSSSVQAGTRGSVLEALAAQASRGLGAAGLSAEAAATGGAVAALGARSIATNAVLDASMQLREAEITGRPLIASEVISQATLSGLLGLGIEGLFAGFGAAAGRVGRRASARASRMPIGDFVTRDAAGNMTYNLGRGPMVETPPSALRSILSGGNAEDIATLRSHPYAADALNRSATEMQEQAAHTADLWTNIINKTDDIIPQATTPGQGAIARLGQLANTPIDSAASLSRIRVSNMADDMAELLSTGRAAAEGLSPIASRAREALEAFASRTGQIADDGTFAYRNGLTTGALFEDLYRLRENIKGLGLDAAGGSTANANQKALVDRLYAQLGDTMRDTNIFGDTAAAYATYADNIEQVLNARKVLEDAFTVKRAGLDGEMRPVPNDGKVIELAKKIETARNGIISSDVVGGAEAIENSIRTMANDPLLQQAGVSSSMLADEISNLRINATQQFNRLALDTYLRGLGEAIGRAERQSEGLLGMIGITPERFAGLGAAVGGVVGTISGGPVGGAWGAAIGGVLGLSGSVAARTSRTMNATSTLARATADFRKRYSKAMLGIEKSLDSRQQVITTSARVLPRMFGKAKTEEEKNNLYFRVVEDVRNLSSNPTAALERLDVGLSGVPQTVAEKLAEAGTRGLAYLSSIAPPVTEDPFTGKRTPPSATQRDTFLRAFAGVDDPMVLLEGLAAGNVPQETVDAVRTVYPDFYAAQQGAVANLIAQRRTLPHYSQRVQISRVLGIPADRTLDGQFMVTMQQRYAQTPAQARSLGMSRAPARRVGTLRVEQTYSEAQRLEQ